jgi:hypothetical protein
MFHRMRGKFGIPGAISVVALIFAMGGAAYAAKNYVITSTGQIKPNVLKSLQGKAGIAGTTGAPGPAGALGPAGANGRDGTNGTNGTGVSASESNTTIDGTHCTGIGGSKFVAGSTTTYACNGKAGKNGEDGLDGLDGPQGPPGPTCNPSGECLLPEGATETGVWSASSPKGFILWTAISFPLRLAPGTEPIKQFVPGDKQGGAVAECPGSSEGPLAAPGFLCLYESNLNNLNPPAFPAEGDLTSGASLRFVLLNQEEAAQTNGTWALTAPVAP